MLCLQTFQLVHELTTQHQRSLSGLAQCAGINLYQTTACSLYWSWWHGCWLESELHMNECSRTKSWNIQKLYQDWSRFCSPITRYAVNTWWKVALTDIFVTICWRQECSQTSMATFVTQWSTLIMIVIPCKGSSSKLYYKPNKQRKSCDSLIGNTHCIAVITHSELYTRPCSTEMVDQDCNVWSRSETFHGVTSSQLRIRLENVITDLCFSCFTNLRLDQHFADQGSKRVHLCMSHFTQVGFRVSCRESLSSANLGSQPTNFWLCFLSPTLLPTMSELHLEVQLDHILRNITASLIPVPTYSSER